VLRRCVLLQAASLFLLLFQNVEVRQRRQRPGGAASASAPLHSPIALQLDEDELNQLREYVKQRRQQYREQAGMYNRASENLATRAKTTAGQPRALNKREKRKLRAFGGAKKLPGAQSRPHTASRPVTPKRPVEEDFGAEVKEPASLITQAAFRTMENQVRYRAGGGMQRLLVCNHLLKCYQITHLSRQADTLLAQLTNIANSRASPAKISLAASKPAYQFGGPQMQAKVQIAREKVVAATQPAAARPQPSAAADLVSAATTSIESRERCADDD
jgi:hypothetical protein